MNQLVRLSVRRLSKKVSPVVLLAALLGYAGFFPAPAFADDETEIRGAFAALQTTLQNKDADAALELLSSDTKEYYQLLTKIVIRNKKNEIESLTPLNRIMVDTVKRFVPAAVLKSSKDSMLLLKIAIGKGLAGDEIKHSITLNIITVTGDKASASLNSKGTPLPLRLGFVRENGKWTVDLISMIEQTNAMTEALLARTHVSKEAWVKSTEARMTPPHGYENNSLGRLTPIVKDKAPAQARDSSARKASPTP